MPCKRSVLWISLFFLAMFSFHSSYAQLASDEWPDIQAEGVASVAGPNLILQEKLIALLRSEDPRIRKIGKLRFFDNTKVPALGHISLGLKPEEGRSDVFVMIFSVDTPAKHTCTIVFHDGQPVRMHKMPGCDKVDLEFYLKGNAGTDYRDALQLAAKALGIPISN